MLDVRQEIIIRRRRQAGGDYTPLFNCLKAGDRAGVRALIDGGIPADDVACCAAAWSDDAGFCEEMVADVDKALLGLCFDDTRDLPAGRGARLLAAGARPRPFSLMAEPDLWQARLRDRDAYFRLVSALIDAGASVHARSASTNHLSRDPPLFQSLLHTSDLGLFGAYVDLLVGKGADLNDVVNGRTLLDSLPAKHREQRKWLKQHGARSVFDIVKQLLDAVDDAALAAMVVGDDTWRAARELAIMCCSDWASCAINVKPPKWLLAFLEAAPSDYALSRDLWKNNYPLYKLASYIVATKISPRVDALLALRQDALAVEVRTTTAYVRPGDAANPTYHHDDDAAGVGFRMLFLADGPRAMLSTGETLLHGAGLRWPGRRNVPLSLVPALIEAGADPRLLTYVKGGYRESALLRAVEADYCGQGGAPPIADDERAGLLALMVPEVMYDDRLLSKAAKRPSWVTAELRARGAPRSEP